MNIELLSPAGDFESLHAALRFGADAVYLGAEHFSMRGGFGARRARSDTYNGNKFCLENLPLAVETARAAGKPVYLTCNTIPTNAEAERLPEFLQVAAGAGADALIIADMGVLAVAKKYAPQIPVHMSTQTGIMNYATAAALYELGAARVVLARELSLADIKTIRDKTPPGLELEAFVHGAMCVSVSGRCLMSKYLTNRDANRGECAQPCRWSYQVTEKGGAALDVTAGDSGQGSYVFNARDLCMIEHLREVIASGVTSMKIEGRAKSAYYVAAVTNAYKAALKQANINKPAPEWTISEMANISHRPYGTGFYFGEAGQFLGSGSYIREREYVGVVTDYSPGKNLLRISQRGHFSSDSRLEALPLGGPPLSVRAEAILDSAGNIVPSANKAAEIYYLRLTPETTIPEPGSLLRKYL